MKKIILFFLVFLFAFPAMSGAYAKTEKDYNIEEELNLLAILEISDSEFNEAFDFEKEMSRAEFLRLVNRTNKLMNAAADELPYWDVDKSNKYYNDIAVGLNSRIIDGTTGDRFRPYSNITYAEAVKMISVPLGYKNYAEAKGGYPFGYLDAAREGRFDIGLAANRGLNQGYAVKLIFKALTAPMMIQTSFGSDIKYSSEKDRTLLEDVFDVKKTDGIVKANDITDLSYGVKCAYSGIKIGEEIYPSEDKAYRNMIGYYVNCYYKDDDGNNEVVYVHKDEKNNVTRISGENVIEAKGSKIYYYDEEKSDKRKDVDISVLTKFIYNGKALNYETEYSENILKPENGYIECIDNNDDNVAEVVSILNRYDVVIDGIDVKEGFVSGKYNVGKRVDLSDNVEYEISDLYGKTYGLENIENGASLLIAESFDGLYKKMLYSDEFVEGTVSEYTADNEAVINGEKHKVSKELRESGNNVYPGKSGIYYLNACGDIVNYTQTEENGAKFGLLMNAASEGIGDRAYITLMPTDNDEKVSYWLAKTTQIDGRNYSDTNKILKYLNPQSKSNIYEGIRYWLNEDNKVYKIDTPIVGSEQEDVTLIKRWDFNDSALTYKSGTGIFGGKFFSEAYATTLYGVGAASAGEEDTVECYTPSQVLGDDKACICELYTLGYDSMNLIGIVMRNSDLGSSGDAAYPQSSLYVFEKYSEMLGDDGEQIGVVTYYSAETKMTAYIEIGDKYLIDGYNCGDVFILQTDNKKYIKPSKVEGGTNIAKIYDYKTETYTPIGLKEGVNHGYGVVYKKGNAKVRYGRAGMDYYGMTPKERDVKLSTVQIGGYYGCTLYEIVNGKLKVSIATENNINDYASSGDKADTIVYQTQYGHTRRFCYIRRGTEGGNGK